MSDPTHCMRTTAALILSAYIIWTRLGRASSSYWWSRGALQEARIALQQCFGHDRGLGNLVGVQPWMTPEDYFSASNFFSKLDSYLLSASENGWIKNEKTLIVFPEYIGTWLLLAGEKRRIGSVSSVAFAMLILILSNPLGFLWYFVRSGFRLEQAIFRMNATSVATIYHNTFSRLATKYRVTISAGSVVLPSPAIVDGVLRVKDVFAPLQNVSVLYRPDGTAHPTIVRKIHITPAEVAFTRGGQLEADLPVYETSLGRLGVLVCADTWYPDVYAELQQKQCQVVVAGAWVHPRGAMSAPWEGYQPRESHPSDVPRSVIRTISEHEAWKRYAMQARAPAAGIVNGMTVFLQGNLWQMTGEGRALLVREGKPIVADEAKETASLINMWL